MLKIGFRCVNGTLASVVFGVLISGSAAAQDAPAPAAEPEAAPSSEPAPKIQLTKPRPMIDLATPPPSEPEGRTFHEHDGVYVRINAGLGTLLSASASADGFPDVDGSGLTLSYDLRVGYAPSPGFVLGGSILGATQLTGDWEIGSAKVASGNLSYNVIGPFAEGFPDSHGNLNFGGTLGLAILSADTGADTSAIGVGGAAWVGSGVWVAPDWSIGGLLRLDAATGSKDDVTLTVIALNAMFSVVFN
ncbi:MAG: hypothetical protein RL685_4547 [Pseudomonadota bacterium]|jgi:hypothetical protein